MKARKTGPLKAIAGFKLHIRSDELARLLKARAGYHKRRAEQKQKEVGPLRELLDRTKASDEDRRKAAAAIKMSGYNVQQSDPVGALEADIQRHRVKVVRFAFFAEHLAEGAVYELEGREAESLELINEEEDEFD